MADFCADNMQQGEFDEKVVCGLWQCEALGASQKHASEISTDICFMDYGEEFEIMSRWHRKKLKEYVFH